VQQAVTLRVVGLVLVILVTGAAALSFLSSQAKAQQAAARSHVEAASQAVGAWYQDPFGGAGSYRKLDAAALVKEAPAVSSKVHVTLLAHGRAYCLDDEEGAYSAYYLGGDTSSVHNLNGAQARSVVLVHSSTDTAAAVCANAS
jgi:hypothetical protein